MYVHLNLIKLAIKKDNNRLLTRLKLVKHVQNFQFRKIWRIFAIFAIYLPHSVNAQIIERKIALVIGNSNYISGGRLANPVNDMRIVEKSLREVGFDIVSAPELTRSDFQEKLHSFHDKAKGAAIALIYFAGHGIAAKGTNWMLPIDAELNTVFELDDQAIPLDRVVEATLGAQLRVVVVDACRNNRFGRNWQSQSRGPVVGLLQQNYDDVLVIYSAAPGQTASDGQGENSPFAKALAKHILQPKLPIQLLGGAVRDDVLAETGGEQRPYIDASITGTPVFLVNHPVSATPSQAPLLVDQAQIEALMWQGALAGNSVLSFGDYLERYPSGIFATQARENLRRLQAMTSVPLAKQPFAAVPDAKLDGSKPLGPKFANLGNSGGVGIQLAAFSSRTSAEIGWINLSKQYPLLSNHGHRIIQSETSIGAVYRLLAIADDEISASALCSNLRFAGQPCVVKKD